QEALAVGHRPADGGVLGRVGNDRAEAVGAPVDPGAGVAEATGGRAIEEGRADRRQRAVADLERLLLVQEAAALQRHEAGAVRPLQVVEDQDGGRWTGDLPSTVLAGDRGEEVPDGLEEAQPRLLRR